MVLFSYLPTRRQLNFKIRRPSKYKCEVVCDVCSIQYISNYGRVNSQKVIYNKDMCKKCTRIYIANNFSEKTKTKISQALSNKPKSIEHRKKLSIAISGEKHPQYGIHEWRGKNEKYNIHLDEWRGKTNVEIYGQEKANKISQKLSDSRCGSKNPMYGKPSPVGSGNGWSGWYLESYFRSLLELSFMIVHPNALSAEKISIKYIDHKGSNRTYHPDFIIDDLIIEIKPLKLLNSKNNLLKHAAARIVYGDKFTIYTEQNIMKLSLADIKHLVDNGDVKFIERYKLKYEQYISNVSPSYIFQKS
jgi:hypothetical protein